MANEDIEQKIKLDFQTNADKTAKKVGKLDKSLEDTTKTQKKQTKASDDSKKGLEDMGGGIGGAIKGFKGLIKQMWLVVANPVGLVLVAIVGALALLFKAFTSTKAGAEKFDQIMAGIGATVDVLRDRVLKIAKAIGQFFSGDFKGAIETGKDAVSGFGAEVAAEFKVAADATKSLQEVADSMRDLGVSRAKLNRDLVEAKEIIDDENASYADKLKAIEDVTDAETKQTELELANAQKKLDAIIALNKQSDSGDEDLDAAAAAEIALFNIQEKSASNKIKNGKLQKKADNEEKSRLKEISTARKLQQKEKDAEDAANAKKVTDLANLKIKAEADLKKQIEDLEDKTAEQKLDRQKERDIAELEALKLKGINIEELLISNTEKYNILEDELIEKRRLEKEEKDKKTKEDKLASDKKQADEEAAIEKAKLDQQKAIEDAKKGLLTGAIALAKDIFGKNKKVQKGILLAENATALAKLTINTVEAVGKDTAASPLTFGMPWAGIHIGQGALGAANIISSTAKGLKALGGGSAGSATKVNMGGGSSASAQVGFQASSENQIATTIADNTNEQPPVEAFIIESTVTTAQALARKKQESNSF